MGKVESDRGCVVTTEFGLLGSHFVTRRTFRMVQNIFCTARKTFCTAKKVARTVQTDLFHGKKGCLYGATDLFHGTKGCLCGATDLFHGKTGSVYGANELFHGAGNGGIFAVRTTPLLRTRLLQSECRCRVVRIRSLSLSGCGGLLRFRRRPPLLWRRRLRRLGGRRRMG